MKSGFAHFDNSHHENFCAAVLLLTMEVDDAVRSCVVGIVGNALGLDADAELVGFGREARLAETSDDNYARVDLWLLFKSGARTFYAFVEVKTHDRWDARHVADQVLDQAERRTVARSAQEIRGSVLLAPERLCRRVRDVNARVPAVAWRSLLKELRRVAATSALTPLAIRHLEENMDRPAGLDRPLTLNHFEQATTTISCLRQFLLDCIAEIGGRVRGDPVYMTPGDGQPFRGSGWAWHGLAVPFTIEDQKARLGIYKYAEAPPGEEVARDSLWLEAYLGDGAAPVTFVKFDPPTLEARELDKQRVQLVTEWKRRAPAAMV